MHDARSACFVQVQNLQVSPCAIYSQPCIPVLRAFVILHHASTFLQMYASSLCAWHILQHNHSTHNPA